MKPLVEYTVGEKGFPIFVKGNIKDFSDNQIKHLTDLLLEYGVAVFDKQLLSSEEQVNTCRRFGRCTDFRNTVTNITSDVVRHDALVTLHTKRELDWHYDGYWFEDRAPMHWMYGYNMPEGSKTGWVNMSLVYDSLPEEWKNWLADKKIVCGHRAELNPKTTHLEGIYFNRDRELDVVIENRLGKKTIFIPFYNEYEILGVSKEEQDEAEDFLFNFMQQDRFMYHHLWNSGELVISEHWITMHKRYCILKTTTV